MYHIQELFDLKKQISDLKLENERLKTEIDLIERKKKMKTFFLKKLILFSKRRTKILNLGYNQIER